METFTLLMFCIALMFCVVSNISILYALVAGLLIFLTYGKVKGFSWQQLFRMSLSGVNSVKNILKVFILIGMLTALWRASGTIPVIICYSAALIRPSVYVLVTFLLCCVISILTGTAFGSAATIGVICMTMAVPMGVDPVLAGGAVLSGIYFGDRCSPVSTSALLVCELTGTDIFKNIKRMVRTAAVPFIITCVLYLIPGLAAHGAAKPVDVRSLFAGEFTLHLVLLLPAAAILVLSVFKINVKLTMTISILLAAGLCLTVQKIGLIEIAEIMLFGFHTENTELSAMLNGGGISSMLKVGAIVCISSSYAGLFQGTRLLSRIKRLITRWSHVVSPFGSLICTSAVTAMIACNQTLTIMLTHQLCNDSEKDSQQFAIDLENSAVVIAPLIPWSIASVVPLAAIAAPAGSLSMAFFLYLVPLWNLILKLFTERPVWYKGNGTKRMVQRERYKENDKNGTGIKNA